MGRNKTRRNRNKSGGRRNKNKTNGGGCAAMGNATLLPKIGGGKRKTRKMSKGADSWRKSLMSVYKEMKAKNPNTKFGDAMKEASSRKKAGKL